MTSILGKLKENSTRISVFLLILSVLSWAVSIQTLHLNIGDYGLITSFNVAYWLSLGLLLASFATLLIFRREIGWLLAAQVVFLVVALYLTPFLMEGTPRLVTNFPQYADADYVISHGHLNAAVVDYHSWPGYSLIISQLVLLTKMQSPLLMMGLLPFVIKLLGLLPLYLLSRHLTRNDVLATVITCWIYNLGFWVTQDYLSPQVIALFLLLLVSAVFTLVDKDAKSVDKNSYTVVLILAFFAVVITHALTSIAVLAMAIVLFLFRRLERIQLALLLSTIFLAWSVYGAASEFRFNLPGLWSEAFRLDQILGTVVSQGFAGTATRRLVSYGRVVFSGAVALLAIIGAFLTWRSKTWRHEDSDAAAFAIGGILVFPLSYGSELLHRMYIYALAPLSFFGSKLANYGRVATFATALVFLIFLPSHILVRYGSELLTHTRMPELGLQEFYFEHTEQGYVIGGGSYLTFYEPDLYAQTTILENQWDEKTGSIYWGGLASGSKELYFCVTYYEKLAYSRFTAIPDLVDKMTGFADTSPKYNLAYVNQEATLYNYQRY